MSQYSVMLRSYTNILGGPLILPRILKRKTYGYFLQKLFAKPKKAGSMPSILAGPMVGSALVIKSGSRCHGRAKRWTGEVR